MCCMAMTPSCLACKECVTVAEWCDANPDSPFRSGCEDPVVASASPSPPPPTTEPPATEPPTTAPAAAVGAEPDVTDLGEGPSANALSSGASAEPCVLLSHLGCAVDIGVGVLALCGVLLCCGLVVALVRRRRRLAREADLTQKYHHNYPHRNYARRVDSAMSDFI